MLWLILFHIAFFYTLYTKPFTMATSELLSTFFPSWRHNEKIDPYYWYNQPGHPVLSNYYPSKLLSFLYPSRTNLDTSFKIFLYQSLIHYLWASMGWFLLLKTYFTPSVALFGAITFTYQAYHVKQQPCVIYTFAWLPFMLMHNTFISSVAVGMMLLSGYYPLAIYLLPVVGYILFPHWLPMAIGLVIGLPQVIPFLRYLPKTVRSHSREDVVTPTWEKNFYIGVIPIVLLATHLQWRYLWIAILLMVPYLLKNILPRVYQRAWLVPTYLAIYFSISLVPASIAVPLLIIQSLDLWLNCRVMPTRPYSELPSKPSLAFNNHLTRFLEENLGGERVEGLPFPLFTGLLNKIRTVGYKGGMRLNLMEKYGNNRLRVKFAFCRTQRNWLRTPIKHLYKNPNYA